MNQPRAPRVVVKTPVSFEGRLGTGRGTTFNLSLGGCGLESSADVNMDATMKLQLRIPTDTKPVTVGRARVVWTAGKDCGVEFVNMESTSKLRLQLYIDSLQPKTPTTAKA
jgi:c-di-GMP-binding flagellar brake protein YcgR